MQINNSQFLLIRVNKDTKNNNLHWHTPSPSIKSCLSQWLHRVLLFYKNKVITVIQRPVLKKLFQQDKIGQYHWVDLTIDQRGNSMIQEEKYLWINVRDIYWCEGHLLMRGTFKDTKTKILTYIRMIQKLHYTNLTKKLKKKFCVSQTCKHFTNAKSIT